MNAYNYMKSKKICNWFSQLVTSELCCYGYEYYVLWVSGYVRNIAKC